MKERITAEGVQPIHVGDRTRYAVQSHTAFHVMVRAVYAEDRSEGTLAREIIRDMDSEAIRWLGHLRLSKAELRNVLKITMERPLAPD